MDNNDLINISKTIRYWILKSTSEAGSGHPTSSLSAVELMSALMFSENFKYDVKNPKNINNDRLIFSKGHASPLFYALWAAAKGIEYKELMTLRKLDSRLEGHPTLKFPFTEAPTGSLGQGLSIGIGLALNAKYLDKNNYKTYVLLGDGELEEGQIWEAANIAAKYKLNNLIAIVDVNRLEQVGETIDEWNLETISKKFKAFGWNTIVLNDGHNLEEINKAYQYANTELNQPTIIIAKTIKGKGFSLWENQLDWHSKTLSIDQLSSALNELGEVDVNLTFSLNIPNWSSQSFEPSVASLPDKLIFNPSEKYSTKKVYGQSLNLLKKHNSNIVALDAGVKNSTSALDFQKANPESYFEMYIAEQNMVSIAAGLSRMSKIPFVSTFGAFFSRAYDQIRMASQFNANIKLVGSYSGVSIGMDGQSQMALEDIAMMRSLQNSVVLYPSDAYSMKAAMQLAKDYDGLVYIRASRPETDMIYSENESFEIGGFKIFDSELPFQFTVIAAGITLHEALKAQRLLKMQNIGIQVIDLYSLKPINFEKLKSAIKSSNIIMVEDHFPEGGLGEAVMSGLMNQNYKFIHLAVRNQPMSGKPEELLKYEEIDAEAIIKNIPINYY